MNSKKLPVVAHYNDVFYYKSETFIHNYVSNLKRVHPIYLAREFDNLDLFPIPAEDRYTVPLAWPKTSKLDGLYRRLLKIFRGISFSASEIFLRQHKVEVIHAHFAPQGFFALDLRGTLNIPIITSFYGYDVVQLPQDPLWAERYQTLFKEGNLFLVEGEFMKSKLIEMGCPPEKVQIQHIAIPLEKIKFRARAPKKDTEKVIFIFSGRFYEKKGLIYALKAFEKVYKTKKSIELRIIGDGELKNEFVSFIQKHHLAGCVKMLGFLDYENYLKQMQQADIFIHPSVTAADGDSEGGAPTVILEAQAMGLPVISTNHADIPNIVVPGKSALLSNERDVEALVNHITYLLENPAQWLEMGRVGREYVEAHHDIKHELNELENKYVALIEKN